MFFKHISFLDVEKCQLKVWRKPLIIKDEHQKMRILGKHASRIVDPCVYSMIQVFTSHFIIAFWWTLFRSCQFKAILCSSAEWVRHISLRGLFLRKLSEIDKRTYLICHSHLRNTKLITTYFIQSRWIVPIYIIIYQWRAVKISASGFSNGVQFFQVH